MTTTIKLTPTEHAVLLATVTVALVTACSHEYDTLTRVREKLNTARTKQTRVQDWRAWFSRQKDV